MRAIVAAVLSTAALGACCISLVAPPTTVASRCPVAVSPDPAPAGTPMLAGQRVECGPAATQACLDRLRRAACQAGGSALYSVHPEKSDRGTALVAAVAAPSRG